MNKPREWTLGYWQADMKGASIAKDELVHVIEYSAYKRMLARLKEALQVEWYQVPHRADNEDAYMAAELAKLGITSDSETQDAQ